MSLQIAVVIAAYNEATVIEKTCRDILNAPPSNLHLVIVDDGSTDDTFKKATNLPRATALRHSINMGQGAALQTGIEYAVRNNFSYVITFDADGQHKISDALAMLDYIQKNPSFDIVIGSRFLKSDRPLKIPLKKILLLKLATKFTSWSTGLNLTDTHNGLRVFPLKTAAKLKITQNGMAHASEILELIAKENLNFKEHHTEILYTEYSIAKGQKISNSLNILWELFTKRMKQ